MVETARSIMKRKERKKDIKKKKRKIKAIRQGGGGENDMTQIET